MIFRHDWVGTDHELEGASSVSVCILWKLLTGCATGGGGDEGRGGHRRRAQPSSQGR